MKTWLGLIATVLAWAITYHVGKHAVGMMAPLQVAIWRFTIASLVLVPWVVLSEGIHWRNLGANLVPLAVMGVVGVSGFNLGMFYGLRETSAVNAALIMAFNPALTAVLAALVAGERIRPLRWFGLLLGIAGVLTVVTRGSWRALLGLSFGHGELLLLGGSLAWALYSVVPRRFVRDLSALQITAASIVISVIAMMALATHWHQPPLVWPPTPALPSLLFMGVGASALAYIWWNAGVLRVGPGRAAIFMNLTPLLTAGIGILLGQPLVQAQWIGAGLVIAGVLCAVRA